MKSYKKKHKCLESMNLCSLSLPPSPSKVWTPIDGAFAEFSYSFIHKPFLLSLCKCKIRRFWILKTVRNSLQIQNTEKLIKVIFSNAANRIDWLSICCGDSPENGSGAFAHTQSHALVPITKNTIRSQLSINVMDTSSRNPENCQLAFSFGWAWACLKEALDVNSSAFIYVSFDSFIFVPHLLETVQCRLRTIGTE